MQRIIKCDHKHKQHAGCCTPQKQCGFQEGNCTVDDQCAGSLVCKADCSWSDPAAAAEDKDKCCAYPDQLMSVLNAEINGGSNDGRSAARKMKAMIAAANRGYQYVVSGCDLKDSITDLVEDLKASWENPGNVDTDS